MSEILIAQTDVVDKVVGQRIIIEEGGASNKEPQDFSISGGSNFLYALAAIGLLAISVWAIKQYTKRPTLRAPVAVVPTKKVK